MELAFYGFGIISIIFTVFAILSKNPMYSLIYLIISFLSTSGVLFSLGAFFVAALEVIIYAGAIMVLFVFIIMMFNVRNSTYCLIISNKSKVKLFLFFILFLVLIFSAIFMLSSLDKKYIFNSVTNIHEIGIKLFSDYILIVELASILLLSALVIVCHVGQNKKKRSKLY
ncbi:MAG: NADH-quinone oxidoreductase subunit J [Buchnera aphidicola (Floraphis choui)]